jgi:hypothetical protein
MDELDIGFYPVDVMHISRAWTGNVDVRKNALIQQALVMLGLFHSGISASLDSVKIISNFDTATVQCSFTITNNDKERLMIIDPDKMGTPLFHYYTNGVVFRGNGTLFQSEYKKVTSPGVAYDTSWYSGLSPQESMKRTVTVKGYPKIPPGTYSCSFTFANPVEVAKENRQTAGGRIWLGDVEARSIEVVIR